LQWVSRNQDTSVFGLKDAHKYGGCWGHMESISAKARAFIDAIVLTGFVIFAFGLGHWHHSDPVRFAGYLLLALLASGIKLSLPGIHSTFSLISVFVMVGMTQLAFPELVFMSFVGTLVQCYWHAKKPPKRVHVFFSVANMTIAVGAAYFVYHSSLAEKLNYSLPLILLVTGGTLFVANTTPVAAVISLTENKSFKEVWTGSFAWSFPFYLIGAAVAGIVSVCTRAIGWQTWLFVVPVVYSIHRSCRLYLKHLEAEKEHLQDLSELQMRTIEILALAVEAKDATTHDHLHRVRTYAEEVGKHLGLCEQDLEALRAAAVLHDIGKLAVPEHIIAKPGKLTPEEFEKMKIHPIVGAEIVDQVEFPYAVSPIVRAHHEKWDGSGYPYGLKREEIPIGARILSAVDCLDALSSDRQYRRALPLEKAMEIIEKESGRSFDPTVVKVLKAHYAELDEIAKAKQKKRKRLSIDLKIPNGQAPDAGFASNGSPTGAHESAQQSRQLLAVGRAQAKILVRMTEALGTFLGSEETLSLLAIRLRRLIPFDTLAIYSCDGERLHPEYVCGGESLLFSSLRIPVGTGVSGWVAENCKPIINGNPAVETGYLEDPTKLSNLQSTLAVPLRSPGGLVGVISLYRAGTDAFNRHDLKLILGMSRDMAIILENVAKYCDLGSQNATLEDVDANTKSLLPYSNVN
jgi:putative nucleotidyltransferase with HDIG domain